MDTPRIAELLEPFLASPSLASTSTASTSANYRRMTASSALFQHISTYIDILLRWNSRINLTAIRNPEDVVTRHFGESLFAASHLFPRDANGIPVGSAAHARPEPSSLADIGSGAGFPGLPIKLWAPHISLTLIESNHKKAAFLREVSRALTLTDVNIQNTRAETLVGSAFTVVTLRAVERFEKILPVAAGLVAPAGRLALLIGAAQEDEAKAALPDVVWSEAILVPGSRARILLTGQVHDAEVRRVPKV